MSEDQKVILEEHFRNLAAAIKKHPILYYPRRTKMSTKQKLDFDTAWEQVSIATNFGVDTCQRLWIAIKSKFVKYRRKLDDGVDVKPWPLYEELVIWLNGNVAKRCSKMSLMRLGVRVGADLPEHSSIERVSSDVDIEVPSKRAKVDSFLQKDEDLEELQTQVGDNESIVELVNEQSNAVDTTSFMSHSNAFEQSAELSNTSNLFNSLSSTSDVLMEQFLTKCADGIQSRLTASTTKNTLKGPNESFGNFIASLISELPPENQVEARLETIKFVEAFVAKQRC